MKFKIRKFRKEDAKQVLALNRALAAFHDAKAVITAKQFLQAFLRGGPAKCYVAEVEGRIIGFSTSHDRINFTFGSRYCFVDLLYTHEKFRRHGIGVALMRHVAKEALKRGCYRVELHAHKRNKTSNAFYKKIGFSLGKNHSNKYVIQGKSLPQFLKGKI